MKDLQLSLQQKVVLQSTDSGGWILLHAILFCFLFFKNVLKTCIIFFPLHNYAPPCVGLSHTILLKIHLCLWLKHNKLWKSSRGNTFANHCTLYIHFILYYIIYCYYDHYILNQGRFVYTDQLQHLNHWQVTWITLLILLQCNVWLGNLGSWHSCPPVIQQYNDKTLLQTKYTLLVLHLYTPMLFSCSYTGMLTCSGPMCYMMEQVQSMKSAPSCQLPDAVHLRTPQENLCWCHDGSGPSCIGGFKLLADHCIVIITVIQLTCLSF